MSDEHRYMLGYQNADGEFDVFARFRGKAPLTDEKLKAVIREVLQNATIIKDSHGKFHLVEKGQTDG